MANFDVNEYLRQPDLRKALDGMATSINVVLNGQQLMGAHGEALGKARVGFALLVFPMEGEQVVVEYRANHDNALWAAAMLRFKAAELAPIPMAERMKQAYHLLEGDKRAGDIRAAIEAYMEEGADDYDLIRYREEGKQALRNGIPQTACPYNNDLWRRFWLNGWLAEEQR